MGHARLAAGRLAAGRLAAGRLAAADLSRPTCRRPTCREADLSPADLPPSFLINTPLPQGLTRKVFAAAEEARHVERNDGRRERSEHDRSEARPSCSEDHARPTLRSSTKTVFPAKIPLIITLFRTSNRADFGVIQLSSTSSFE
uniref:Uncharacterized protein n=1 Tax=Meloidogyne incognita TaxID=6306 RepID=A0A914NKA4_MELIC